MTRPRFHAHPNHARMQRLVPLADMWLELSTLFAPDRRRRTIAVLDRLIDPVLDKFSEYCVTRWHAVLDHITELHREALRDLAEIEKAAQAESRCR